MIEVTSCHRNPWNPRIHSIPMHGFGSFVSHATYLTERTENINVCATDQQPFERRNFFTFSPFLKPKTTQYRFSTQFMCRRHRESQKSPDP